MRPEVPVLVGETFTLSRGVLEDGDGAAVPGREDRCGPTLGDEVRTALVS